MTKTRFVRPLASSRLYCKTKGCAIVSVGGSFDKGRRYKCPECGHALSSTPVKHGKMT